MRRLSNAPATAVATLACLMQPISIVAFVSDPQLLLLLPRHRRALPAASSNTLWRFSRQKCQMIGVAAIAGRKRTIGCTPLALDVTSGVSGDSGGDNRVDGELQRVPNIRGKMMEILRPDLKRVRGSSKAMYTTLQQANVCT